MIELSCEYLSVRCIWLYVFVIVDTEHKLNVLRTFNLRPVSTGIMPRTHFRVNLHSTVAWISKNSLLESDAILKFNWLQWDPVWLNGWVFVYELSGCGFESRLLSRSLYINIFIHSKNFHSWICLFFLVVFSSIFFSLFPSVLP